MTTNEWPLVSVVITGYKRPDLLAQTVESLLAVVRYEPLELVLADDASPEELQAPMRALPFDRFVFAETNRGLGANTNAGLAAATGEFVLQMQDDWRCTGPPDFLQRGVRLMQQRPAIGLLRYTRRFGPHPGLPPEREHDCGEDVHVFPTDPSSPYFLYSDHPHLKSRAFIDAIGPYDTGRYMHRTEVDMRQRFAAQRRFEAAFIDGYETFEHIGDDASLRELPPSTRLAARIDTIPVLRWVTAAIRALRDHR